MLQDLRLPNNDRSDLLPILCVFLRKSQEFWHLNMVKHLRRRGLQYSVLFSGSLASIFLKRTTNVLIP